mgnify:CR=1 FL=1
MDSNTIAKLQEEHKLLADRAKSSRDEADQIRSALKQQQSVLNQAESELNQAQAELTQLESQIQSLQLELKNKQAQAQSAQEALGLAHQKTAELAQSLGPVAQKQKRFEDALAMVVQNLASANLAPISAPTPPSPPAPPVLSTPAVPNIMPKAPKVPNSAVPPSIPMPSSSANMQSAKVDSEKRAPRRDIEMSLSFEIALDSGSEHNFYTGLTDNISEGGIFIATTQILDIGTQIKFPLALPSMLEPEQVEGVVKWVRREGRADANVPSGIGIQFTQISDSFKARINQYIQSSDTIFYDD